MGNEDYEITCEEVPLGSVAQLTPGLLQKVVHLVRHGQAVHNLYAQGRIKEGEACPCMTNAPGCPYRNERNADARLTQRGRLQATTVGRKLMVTKPVPELVLVSPLYRTLQTCAIALSTVPHLCVPVVADETIRERIGLHVCDRRSDKAHLLSYFNTVDFAHVAAGPDALFGPDRETEEATAKRGKHFLMSLLHREETSVALFTHSSLLYNTLSKALITPDPKTARRFVTGEVRCVLLTYAKA